MKVQPGSLFLTLTVTAALLVMALGGCQKKDEPAPAAAPVGWTAFLTAAATS
ncbi:MAG TPA: hypothetical protein VFH73_07430 [Polyangia bacterium]|jgi:hypothetical protein|nr:hypothetical protein [Polyangia bacterium]